MSLKLSYPERTNLYLTNINNKSKIEIFILNGVLKCEDYEEFYINVIQFNTISLPGGTPGWLWNLRPGSRGRGPASIRRLGPAPATSGRAGTSCHLQSPPAANPRPSSMHAPT